MTPPKPPPCWALTTGEAGMRAQAIGLAERIGLDFAEKRVHLGAPWRWLPGNLGRFGALGGERRTLSPPWPRLLISCGRRSAAFSIAIKNASGGKTFTVHIQDPLIAPRHFDVVASLRHDKIAGDNVFATRGALHGLTAQKLAAAGAHFAPLFADLPRPLLAVLIGGNSKAFRLSAQKTVEIAERLKALMNRHGVGVIVTPSRRTGAENEKILRDRLSGTGAVVWDGGGENPYLGMLALADHIVATGDSVSMVSEACATGKPVSIIDLEGGSKRFAAFHRMLREEGITRPFTGELEHWEYAPLDDTTFIADLVRTRMELER
ncbi:mitochondrial fission ELM1 family protein [Varunaivibrio sulfuroxidans]|uniref:Mitochondrial fission protein ELM1 n=1 Tax=Varunaivibrio sulfuroxidans TaxID=1773489 RepID=A0A4R3J8K8_9PROT|nr:mitochondrial fission ELM1 family protein [Varunaivibrio sulfuroxidans]TCS60860.1 hypothetical protein EDD55_10920 [Varunaivibrio sulfuroxidans]WES31726.1 mitochondrial fission ELM1 family protein [Varunaivibrio sulfuroxidans]